MKSKFNKVITIVISILAITTFFISYRNNKINNSLRKNISSLSDSLDRMGFDKFYLSQLVDFSLFENEEKYNVDSIEVYKIIDGNPKYPMKLNYLLSHGRKKLIVRYNEIGCNACTDSVFSILKHNSTVSKYYDIYVLVDFSNYDSYLKWKKIEELDYPVLWLKKQVLPFNIEMHNSTYIFTVSPGLNFGHFFIPNSAFPSFIHKYFNKI